MNIGWFFIIVGAILGGLATYLRLKHELLIIILAIMMTLSLLSLAYGAYLVSKSRPFLTGMLETVTINPEKNFTVKVGSNLFITDYEGLVNGFDMRRFIEYGHEYPIKIKASEGKLLVSAWIGDEEGKMVAHIVDNNWGVNPDNRYDRNFSNSALEVVDNDKMPVLQVAIQSGNCVYIGGVFYYSGGRVVVTPEGMYINPIGKVKPTRIFKYPGDKYLGILDK